LSENVGQAVIAGVRDLLPMLRDRAQETEDAREVPAESVKALEQTGFFRLLQPARFGGHEADPITFLTAVRLIASACGSTGWVASVVGVLAGVLMAWYPPVDAIVSPLMKSLYPMPKSALIPVMILWFGLGAGSKIASIFMGCLLPVVLSSYNGARGTEQTLIWSALGLGASRRQVLWEIVVPNALPEILAGVRNALAISFILLVSSEFLVGQRGLGYLISFLGDGGVYDAMFAAVLTVSAIGFFADRIYLFFMQRALQWRE